MFDSDSYMNEMRALLKSGKAVSMVLSGNSMVPFLVNQRDLIYIEPLPSELKVGDMCFFQRDDGRFIMHRICRVTKDGCF
ncbi:MAG: S24/S26 family peptidase, partial [Lachnospiraceae bacterium]|nr:S24/S26 family peptidase [Lachnospiraceae bacterium]